MKKSNFTPEAVAANKRPPEDAWTDKGPWTIDDWERVKRERPKYREISPRTYLGKFSLRNILPNRWGVAYQESEYESLVDYKTETYETKVGYTELKHDLLYKSFILGYGIGPIRRRTTKELSDFIKYHCSSALRLKALSLRAYEDFSGMSGMSNWTSMGWPVYLCLASAKSSMDSVAAILWALIFQTTKVKPGGKRLPDMNDLWLALCPPKKPKLAFGKEFDRLVRSRWYQRLLSARNAVVHHGMWPKYHPKLGVALQRDLGSFIDRAWGIYSTSLEELRPKKSVKMIRLDQIMVGFIEGLEKWEARVASALEARPAAYKSFMEDGVIIRVNFNPNGPLQDFGGVEGMLKSESDDLIKIQVRRAQRKTKHLPSKSKVKP